MEHIDAADLAAWSKGGVSATDPAVGSVVAAVNSYVDHLGLGAEDDPRAPEVKLGALMLAHRTFRRRTSPNGIETVTAETVAYVARTDPDISRFLRLDTPRVG